MYQLVSINRALTISLLTCILSLGTAACTSNKIVSTTEKYVPATVDMNLEQVTEHVYYVSGKPGIATDNQGFISNAGFVVTNEGVVVFDTLGTPSLAAKLLQSIRKITDQPIRKVVVSHYHADHVYGLQVFEELGAEIIAPEGAQTYIHSEAASVRLDERRFSLEPWVNDDTYLVLPDVTVSKSYTFSLGGMDFIINYIGKAHSDGDLAMLVEPAKVLFSGDIIFESRIPFVGNGDTAFWLDTLTKLETNGLNVLIPGHGPASTQANSTISLTRKYLAYLRQIMGSAVDEFRPFAEAYDEADWSQFEHLPAFEDGNRINAYQVYLSLEAELLAK